MNYEEDLEIDQDSLDQEWLKQPSLMRRYTKEKAEAKKIWDKTLEVKKTIRSELILEAKEFGIWGIEKITDSAIEAWYRIQKKYMDAVNEVIKAEYNYNMIEGAISSLIDKKHGLQELVHLYTIGYFSDPKEPKESNIKGKAIFEADEKQVKNLNKKINKNRKKKK